MRISTIGSHVMSELPARGGLRIEQRGSVLSSAMFLLILVPAVVAMLLPAGVLGGLAISDPGMRVALAERATSTLLIALGLGIWATLWGVPSWRYLSQLGARRSVEIGSGRVHAVDRAILGRDCWSCPLDTFEGLSHNVRTTISGARHELVLVHPDPKKCVLVYMAPIISDVETRRMAEILGLGVSSEPAALVRGNAHAVSASHSDGEQALDPLAA